MAPKRRTAFHPPPAVYVIFEDGHPTWVVEPKDVDPDSLSENEVLVEYFLKRSTK